MHFKTIVFYLVKCRFLVMILKMCLYLIITRLESHFFLVKTQIVVVVNNKKTTCKQIIWFISIFILRCIFLVVKLFGLLKIIFLQTLLLKVSFACLCVCVLFVFRSMYCSLSSELGIAEINHWHVLIVLQIRSWVCEISTFYAHVVAVWRIIQNCYGFILSKWTQKHVWGTYSVIMLQVSVH